MFRSYRPLLALAFRQRSRLGVIALLTMLTAAAAALTPLPLKLIVDNAIGGKPLAAPLARLFAMLSLQATPIILAGCAAAATLLIVLLNTGLDAALTWSWSVAGQRMVRDVAQRVFDRLQQLSLRFHSRRSVGDSLETLTTDSWSIYSLTAAVVVAPVQRFLTLVSVGAVAFTLDPPMALLALSAAPAIGFVSVHFGRKMKKRSRRGREASSRIVSFVQQTLSAIPLVQASAAEHRNRKTFERLGEDVIALTQQSALLNRTYSLAAGSLTTIASAAVLFVGGLRVLDGRLSLGSLLVFIAYMRTLQRAAEGLITTWGTVKPIEASLDRVMEVLSSGDVIPPSAHPLPVPAEAPSGVSEVRFDHVAFAYEPGREVLHDVSFEVRAGQTVAVVGPTGAGKSTLLSLIPRFFDPAAGQVCFRGIDLRHLALHELRSCVALVPQEPLLLPLTIAENIAYGRAGATRPQIIAAAEAANVDEFVARLPEGYDTRISERGASLSVGQRQRITIARALLRDAPVLLLDEPTAALDPNTEMLIVSALERLVAGRTTFIIAHRMSTIRNADTILVLDNGRLVEFGSHHELMRLGGTYARYQRLQTNISAVGPS